MILGTWFPQPLQEDFSAKAINLCLRFNFEIVGKGRGQQEVDKILFYSPHLGHLADWHILNLASRWILD
jgi:hypothetical protein